jgi:hypothetical protein
MARNGFAKRELTFSKVDHEEGVAYGWLIVSTVGGEPYFDLQGDHIPLDAAKRATAQFMKDSRRSDEQHDERTIGDVVYCFPVEKGVTSGIVGLGGEPDQEGIVIGFAPRDRSLLSKIDRGERRGFSIGGSLHRSHEVSATGKSRRGPGGKHNGSPSDVELEQHLHDVVGALSDDEKDELGRHADAMHEENAAAFGGKKGGKRAGAAFEKSAFSELSDRLASKGADNPDALAAYIGRQKYGSKEFAAMGKAGKGGKSRDGRFGKSATEVEPRRLRVFDDFRIDFASLVDWPAQEGALVSIVKAATVTPDTLMWIRKDAVLTSLSAGHQHVIDPDEDLDDDRDRGWTGHATKAGDDYPHCHAFIVDDKTGKIEIAANDGHSHDVDLVIDRAVTADAANASTAQVMENVERRAPKWARGAVAGQNTPGPLASIGKDKENAMDPKKQAELEALAEMSDAHKAHYRTLAKRDQEAFVGLTASQREALVKAAGDSDPVVYKCDDGTEIRKSHGQIAERLARANDANAEKLRKQEERAERAEAEAKATKLMKSYPGDIGIRARILKAVEKEFSGKDDGDALKAAMASIAAGERALAKRSAIGKRAGVNVPDDDGGDGDDLNPEAALEALAKAKMKDDKISYHKAYDAVLKTAEGQELYAEMEVRQGRAGNYHRVPQGDNPELDDYADDDGEVETVGGDDDEAGGAA